VAAASHPSHFFDASLSAHFFPFFHPLIVRRVRKVANLLSMSEACVITSMDRVVEAMLDIHGHEIQMPRKGSARAKEVEQVFRSYSFVFRGCKGIIDCTHVGCTVPFAARLAGAAQAFKDRKGDTSLMYQVVTDCADSPMCLSVVGPMPGFNYDTTLWNQCRIRMNLYKHYFNPKLSLGDNFNFFMGDAGYPLRPEMIRPYSTAESTGQSLEAQRRRTFNKRFSGCRVSVERFFGMYVAYFVCFFLHLARKVA
jgi:hypothetical protein